MRKKRNSDIIHKQFDFEVTKSYEMKLANGEPCGIVEGYASTFGNIDRGRDRVRKGAFLDTIQDHKDRNRDIRVLYNHWDLMGGIKPTDEDIFEDERGLFVRARLALNNSFGRDAYALARLGTLQDFSIGYSIVEKDQGDDGVCDLIALRLWEVSLVEEPMNADAQVTDVKNRSRNNKKGRTMIVASDIEGIKTLGEIEALLTRSGWSQGARKKLISLVAEIKGTGASDEPPPASDPQTPPPSDEEPGGNQTGELPPSDEPGEAELTETEEAELLALLGEPLT